MVWTAMSCAIILGAGFSFAAGLPLTSALFETDVLVTSKGAGRRFSQVLAAWERWQANAGTGPEQFMDAAYRREAGVHWRHVVEFVAAVLATPRGADRPAGQNPRYAGRITVKNRSEFHNEFWNRFVRRFGPLCVVTTNYDLLIERALRHRPMKRTPMSGIYYGGLARPQVLKGLAQPWTVRRPQRYVELTGTLPLYKLHGSLNWSFEKGELVMYQDMRAVFRKGGTSAIVPPVTEKTVPDWLSPVWEECRSVLSACHTWFVCGYSLPPYDEALMKLFKGSGGDVERLFLSDPYARGELESRWRGVAPGASIVCLPGLPDVLKVPPLV